MLSKKLKSPQELKRLIVFINNILNNDDNVLPGPPSGGGLLLEDGINFLLLESGDFLLLEE